MVCLRHVSGHDKCCLRLQGAFLVRPSMSLPGTMVISAVTGGRIKHMALDGNQLDSRSLEVLSFQDFVLPSYSSLDQCCMYARHVRAIPCLLQHMGLSLMRLRARCLVCVSFNRRGKKRWAVVLRLSNITRFVGHLTTCEM
jgi:SH2 domain